MSEHRCTGRDFGNTVNLGPEINTIVRLLQDNQPVIDTFIRKGRLPNPVEVKAFETATEAVLLEDFWNDLFQESVQKEKRVTEENFWDFFVAYVYEHVMNKQRKWADTMEERHRSISKSDFEPKDFHFDQYRKFQHLIKRATHEAPTTEEEIYYPSSHEGILLILMFLRTVEEKVRKQNTAVSDDEIRAAFENEHVKKQVYDILFNSKISGEGFIQFLSEDEKFIPGETNQVFDVDKFEYDPQTGTVQIKKETYDEYRTLATQDRRSLRGNCPVVYSKKLFDKIWSWTIEMIKVHRFDTDKKKSV